MNEANPLLINVLYDLMFYWQKKESGETMSAESHFCQAFTRLMKIQPLWQPYDEESKEFVEYAKELMNKSGFKP